MNSKHLISVIVGANRDNKKINDTNIDEIISLL